MTQQASPSGLARLAASTDDPRHGYAAGAARARGRFLASLGEAADALQAGDPADAAELHAVLAAALRLAAAAQTRLAAE